MEINYYINNVEIEPPINDAELSVELNAGDETSQAISLNEFEFGIGSQTVGNDASTLINLHRSGGLGSGEGVFAGLPFRIELTHNGQTENLADGYLDTSRAVFDCDKVICPYVEKGNIDWLNEVADRYTFAYLYEKTSYLKDSDFTPIPYVLSELPNNREAFMAAISLFLITETITNQLQSLIEFIAGSFTGSASDVIKVILRIIYIIGVLFAAYALIKQIINLLIQPVKYHDGMTVKRLCEVGADSFGFTFSSSILDSNEFENLLILPNKYSHKVNNNKDDILGFLNPSSSQSRGYYNGTFGELLRGLKEMFNAKIIIDGTILRLEREDYNNSAYNYVLPPVDQTSYRLNADELNSNYVVKFQTDLNDKNTLQRYEGTITQVIQQPKKDPINPDMSLMRGLETRNIPFARCTRKTELTLPEKILKELAEVVDFFANQISTLWNEFADLLEDIIAAVDKVLKLITLSVQDFIDLLIDLLDTVGIDSLFGEDIDLDTENLPKIVWTNLGDLVDDRVGMLQMENDWIEQQKIGISSDQTYINSEYLNRKYHYLRSFVPRNKLPAANQYKIRNAVGVPFCWDDYILLKNNSFLQSDEGVDSKLISAKWNVRNQIAEIDYKSNELYTNNIKEKIITPNGK